MAEANNWIVVLPFDGSPPKANSGFKRHFELLQEVAPELKKEINLWAAGVSIPPSPDHILARGNINNLNRIVFKECPGNRNTVYDIVDQHLRQRTAKTSPYFEPQNILSMLIVRAMNEHIPDEQDLHDVMQYGKSIASCEPSDIFKCLDDIMSAENPAAAIRLAEQTKLLRYLVPEVADTKNFWQKYKKHSSELFSHLMMTLDHVAKNTGSDKKNLRWAALLHDIGKVKTVWVDDDGLTNWNGGPNGDHEVVGSEMAEELLKRLGMPEQDRDEVVFFIRNHMFDRFDSKKDAKKFVEAMGSMDRAYDMLALGLADEQGKRKQEEKEEKIFDMLKLLDKLRSKGDWEEISDPTIIVVLKESDII
jgi:putative nucleotidyltransferase with HDIG domain